MAPAAQTSGPPSGGPSHLEFLQTAQSAVAEWTRFADPKALGVLVLLSLGISDLLSHAPRYLHTSHTAGTAATACAIIAAFVACLVVWRVTVALFSRLTMNLLGKASTTQPSSHFYFGEVSKHLTEADYVTAVLGTPEEDLLKDLAGQVYQVSRVCQQKHVATQQAYALTLTFLVLWAASRVLLAA